MKQTDARARKGFTLIELLLVIGIIAVLAVVVFVALDPVTRFADARDARRESDVQTILSAIHQYVIDNKGAMPTGLNTTEKQLGTAASGCEISSGACSVTAGSCLDMSTDLAKYLKSVPYDPENGSDATTHYSVQLNADGIATVRACDTEGDVQISVSR